MHAPTPSRDLVHPLFLAAVGVLLVNDHVLKGSPIAPGWLTGKLSDFAGLFFFPVLVLAVLDLVTRGRARARRAVFGCAAAALTALGFSLVKLSPSVNAWIGAHFGPMSLDATDLIALPSTLASFVFLTRGRSGAKGLAIETPRALPWTKRALRFVALAIAGLACVATPAPQRVRNYPYWRIESLGPRPVGCAKVDAWVSKSGKEGFGVTLSVDPLSEPCTVKLRSARFLAEGVTSDAAALPAPVTLAKPSRTYVPFEFDNETLWNSGVRDGRLELVLVADGAEAGGAEAEGAETDGAETVRLELALRHVYGGPHARRRSGESPP